MCWRHPSYSLIHLSGVHDYPRSTLTQLSLPCTPSYLCRAQPVIFAVHSTKLAREQSGCTMSDSTVRQQVIPPFVNNNSASSSSKRTYLGPRFAEVFTLYLKNQPPSTTINPALPLATTKSHITRQPPIGTPVRAPMIWTRFDASRLASRSSSSPHPCAVQILRPAPCRNLFVFRVISVPFPGHPRAGQPLTPWREQKSGAKDGGPK